ncbi:MAG: nucleotidyltransferase domain-containing protein [Chloroflexota bacterium]
MVEEKEILKTDEQLNTRQITPELINYIVEKIVREVAPVKIVLFGSRARGNAGPNSDIDLFIVHDSQTTNRLLRRKIDGMLSGRRFGVDLIVRTPADVKRNMDDNNPFYSRHIFKYGKVLYERP